MGTQVDGETLEEITRVLESLLKALRKMYRNGGVGVTEDGVMVSGLILATDMSFVDSPPPTCYLELMIEAGWVKFGRRFLKAGRRLQSGEAANQVDLNDCIKLTLAGTLEAERLQQPAYRRRFKEACGFIIENAAKGATDAAIRRLLHQ